MTEIIVDVMSNFRSEVCVFEELYNRLLCNGVAKVLLSLFPAVIVNQLCNSSRLAIFFANYNQKWEISFLGLTARFSGRIKSFSACT